MFNSLLRHHFSQQNWAFPVRICSPIENVPESEGSKRSLRTPKGMQNACSRLVGDPGERATGGLETAMRQAAVDYEIAAMQRLMVEVC